MPRFGCGPHQSIEKSSDFDKSSISSIEHLNKILNISLRIIHDVVIRVNDQFMRFVEIIVFIIHNRDIQNLFFRFHMGHMYCKQKVETLFSR